MDSEFALKTEEFDVFANVFVRTPSPCGQGMTQKSKIYEFAVDLFGHLSEIVFKYSILAK